MKNKETEKILDSLQYASEWLYKNTDPYHAIIITSEGAKLVSVQYSAPFPKED